MSSGLRVVETWKPALQQDVNVDKFNSCNIVFQRGAIGIEKNPTKTAYTNNAYSGALNRYQRGQWRRDIFSAFTLEVCAQFRLECTVLRNTDASQRSSFKCLILYCKSCRQPQLRRMSMHFKLFYSWNKAILLSALKIKSAPHFHQASQWTPK